MRVWLLCFALILVSCTPTPTVQPTLRGPIVPTRLIPSATPTDTLTQTPTATLTFTATTAATFTATNTATLTFTPSQTATATTIPSDTPTATRTASPTATIPSQTPTVTASPTQTALPDATATSTVIPSLVPTAGEPVFYRNSSALESVVLTGSLSLNTPISNTIDDQHPAVLYTFNGTAGTNIDVAMHKQTGNLDPFLLVLDPKGREMARNDDAASDNHDAGIRALPIPETGTYVVVATRYGQQFGETGGDFDLTVTTTPDGETAVGLFSLPTGYNSLVNGTLDADNSQLVYTFRATAGDVISIQMTHTSGNLDPNVAITNNLGTIIVFNDDNLLTGSLDSGIQSYIIPRSGFYSIVAGHFTGADNSGSYRLKLALDSQNAAGIDAIVDTINSSTVNDAGKLYTNYSIGDELDDNNQEHTFQSLITFHLPPISEGQSVQSATFQMQPCYLRGGGFATLGDMTIYQDNFGSIGQSHDLTHPLPGARVLSSQDSCDPLDLTSLIQDAYDNGIEDIQLRLIFRNHTDNGVEDEVLITPNLRLMFG
ncbi:MAG: pre-peptidase C-terminal domain-containing protein [Chloroflexota bacterium]